MADKKKVSTQSHVPFSAIYDDVVVTKKGQFCQVIMVNSVNFGLKSEDEQNAIISQYQAFLNSVSFPIEIVMHSKRLDLTNYIKDLQGRITKEPNELIRYQIQEYIDFITKLISIANIMDKKFFIVIPIQLHPGEMPRTGLLTSLLGNPNEHLKVPLKDFLVLKQSLQERSNLIISGLASMGITSQILSTKQLIELFYRTYNSEDAQNAKLPQELQPIGVETQQGTPIQEQNLNAIAKDTKATDGGTPQPAPDASANPQAGPTN